MENRPSDFTRFFRHRMDTGIHVMDWTTTIASSKVADMMMGCSEMPSINVIVAISTLGTIRKTQLSSTRLPPSAVCSRAPITIPYVRLSEEHHHRRGGAVLLPSDEQVVDNRSTTARSRHHFPETVPLKANDVVIAEYMPNRAKRNATRVTR
jgi:hypothetical protein